MSRPWPGGFDLEEDPTGAEENESRPNILDVMQISKKTIQVVVAFLTMMASSIAISVSAIAASELSTPRFIARVDGGFFTAFVDPATGRNYLPTNAEAPILQVQKAEVDIEKGDFAVEERWGWVKIEEDKLSQPSGMRWLEPNRKLLLSYDDIGVEATIEIKVSKTYFTMCLLEVKPADSIYAVVWGPYPTTIRGLIGGQVGVSRNKDYAMGIQALNAKTTGGFPWAVEAPEQDVDISLYGYNPYLLTRIGKQRRAGTTAQPQEYGSSLQAWCKNRSNEFSVNDGPGVRIPDSIEDGGIIGSAVALFGCPEPLALETIGAIEIAEGLPHPTFNGEWLKTSRKAAPLLLIMPFGEDADGYSKMSIDETLDIAQRGGFDVVYSWKDMVDSKGDHFKSWGHFELEPGRFPNGHDGLRMCAEKARKRGILLGFKTLSNMIAKDDPYLTPVPDPRLATRGYSFLAADIDAATKEIPITHPDLFRRNSRQTVRIDRELITFSGVSEQEPWRLTGCQRGTSGTTPSAHAADTKAHILDDTGFRGGRFIAGTREMCVEMAERLAGICNDTGMTYMAHDGLEYSSSYGQGEYACDLFSKAWFDAMTPESRKFGPMLEASRATHYTWHLVTHYGWGEVWNYAQGFRTWHTDYRYNRQFGYRRNLMPNMLGHYCMDLNQSLEDIEWLMARAAGFNAGFFLALPPMPTEHPQMEQCLDAIREWKALRLKADLSRDLRWALQDDRNEFHLETVKPDREWNIYQIYSHKDYLGKLTGYGGKVGRRIQSGMNSYRYSGKRQQQSGIGKENPSSLIEVNNPNRKQPVWMILTNIGGAPIRNIRVKHEGKIVLASLGELAAGNSIEMKDGVAQLFSGPRHLCDAPRKLEAEPHFMLPGGKSVFEITWEDRGSGHALDVDIRSIAPPVRVVATRP